MQPRPIKASRHHHLSGKLLKGVSRHVYDHTQDHSSAMEVINQAPLLPLLPLSLCLCHCVTCWHSLALSHAQCTHSRTSCQWRRLVCATNACQRLHTWTARGCRGEVGGLLVIFIQKIWFKCQLTNGPKDTTVCTKRLRLLLFYVSSQHENVYSVSTLQCVDITTW